MTQLDRSRRDELAQRLRDSLTAFSDKREVRMFGGLSFMVNGRLAIAAGRDGDLLVHIDPDEYDNLVQRGGEPAFMGADRPMGACWLTVQAALLDRDSALAFWVAVGVASGEVAN